MKLRQIYPLLLAYADDGLPIKGRTRLQKMIFLYQIQLWEKDPAKDLKFGFVPYNYGPYSATLQSDVEYLIDEGFLKENPKQDLSGKYLYEYEMTSKGKRFAEALLTDDKYSEYNFDNVVSKLNKIKDNANYTDLDTLLKKVYSEHPEYAKFSIYEF